MREIRFRAWSKINNCMYYGCRGFDFESDGCVYLNVIQADSAADKEPIIMQFTGLLDKNGKEIYEGDVCKSNYFARAAEVVFVKGGFFVKRNLSGEYTLLEWFNKKGLGSEVIGNIYEHPELLEATTT